MIDAIKRSLRRQRASSCMVAAYLLVVLAAVFPAGAVGATSTTPTTSILGVHVPTSDVPASARVQGTTTTPANQAPAATTPTTPATGAQPGTVVPSTSTPTTSVPPASVPSSTAATPASATPTSPTTSSSTTVVGVAHKTSPKSTRLSAGALALAILAGLLVLGCIVWVLGRWLALEPRWTVSLLHSLREASYHGSATWAEFADWARIGR